jgi:hypothetical protein
MAAARAADPLAAVPVRLPDTRVEALPEGLLLYRAEPARGRVSAWFGARLGWRRERRFELDRVGARFWREIDGKRSLSEIRHSLCADFGLDPEEAGRAVVEFTGKLMSRGLLAVEVERCEVAP